MKDNIKDILYKKANKAAENQLAEKIRHAFPEIKNFTVKVDLQKEEYKITGLTKDQVKVALGKD